MSIEYLNLKGKVEKEKMLTTLMKKLGKEYLLEEADQEEVEEYKKNFQEFSKKGASALVEYLVKVAEDKFTDDPNSNKLVTN